LRRCLSRTKHAIQAEKVLLRSLISRLAANGHTNASTAKLVVTTEGTIRNREPRPRRRIRRLPGHSLPVDTIVDYDRTGGNHHRAREIQMTCPD
jgi:hypothetical protein